MFYFCDIFILLFLFLEMTVYLIYISPFFHLIEFWCIIFFLLVKVWPYEETDEYGFVQSLFQLMHSFFSRELNSISSGPGVKLLKVGVFFFLEN